MSTFDPARPFTVSQGLAAGLSRSVLRGRRYQRVMHGVLITSGTTIDLETRARAAILTHPDGVRISHTTAARLYGIPVPEDPHIHVTVPHESKRRNRTGVLSHVNPVSGHALVKGMPASHGDGLFVELAGMLPLVDAVVGGDAMARKGHLRHHGLGDRLSGTSEPGVVRARCAAALVRAGAESPMESRVRLLVVLAGFPEPVVNQEVRHIQGHYRPDLCWPDLRLILEYDGQHHRSDLDQWDHDIVRREWFQAQGWRVITLVARDVFHRPRRTLERLQAAWREAGGPPLRLSDEWCRHYPDR